MENPERSCRAQCKGYHPELCKYSRATREFYNDRCFRIHLKGTRRKQTPPSTQVPSTTPRTTNQQQAIIGTQNLASFYPSCYRHSPCPPHQLITTPHPLRNISPPFRLLHTIRCSHIQIVVPFTNLLVSVNSCAGINELLCRYQ